ncbi:MAG: putative lipid II flippase FtsW [Planctomycetes bacterium]|nr:putative lipid II flippase FtsW [Planctomycetota bacterium]MCW8135505.1 putative lipid II flippase FtsW [Planctomycetota bacterium]
MSHNLRNAYLLNLLALVGIGVVMVFSSSAIRVVPGAEIDPFVFIKRHLLFVGAGLAAMAMIARIDHNTWLRFAKPLWMLGLVLLVLTLLPGVGTEYNGARRWIRFGGFGFQPSDMAKFTLLLAAAAYATLRRKELGSFRRGFLPACAFVGIYCVLVMAQPDFGTSLFLAFSSFLVLIAGGLRLKHLGVVLLVLLPIASVVMYSKFDHIQSRIMVFLDPAADPRGKGHQVKQSLIAIGSGGMEGQGLGNSMQKLYYLPEQETDFIFAVLAEETGFVGSAITLALFISLMLLGMRIARRSPNRFGSLVALGVTGAVGLQAAINVAVVTASVPTKGIGLPFISFGGSSCFFYLCACGVVLSVARKCVSEQEAFTLLQQEIAGERLAESVRQSARARRIVAAS